MRQLDVRHFISFWLSICTELLAPCSEFSLWFLFQALYALVRLPFFALLIAWEYRQPLLQAAIAVIRWLWWDSPPMVDETNTEVDSQLPNSTDTALPGDCTGPPQGDCMSLPTIASVFVLLGLHTKI